MAIPSKWGIDKKINSMEGLSAYENGGKGSGNFGHQGRPGYVGGSGDGKGSRKHELSEKMKRAIIDMDEDYFTEKSGKWKGRTRPLKGFTPEERKQLKEDALKDQEKKRQDVRDWTASEEGKEYRRLHSRRNLSDEEYARYDELRKKKWALEDARQDAEKFRENLGYYDDEDIIEGWEEFEKAEAAEVAKLGKKTKTDPVGLGLTKKNVRYKSLGKGHYALESYSRMDGGYETDLYFKTVKGDDGKLRPQVTTVDTWSRMPGNTYDSLDELVEAHKREMRRLATR